MDTREKEIEKLKDYTSTVFQLILKILELQKV